MDNSEDKDARKVGVTIVTPMFNSSRYISQVISSIQSQKCDGIDIEFILIDNGSEDDSVDIAEKLGVKVISMPKATIAQMRNYGAGISSGHVIMFVDSDCVLPTRWVQNAVMLLNETENAGAVGGGYGLGDDPTWVEKEWVERRKIRGGDVSFLSAGSLVLYKDLFLEVGGFDDKLITGEDWDLSQKIISSGRRVVLKPELEVKHLGNVRTLRGMFRKERWYGLGMIDNLKHGLLSKPLIAAIIFILLHALILVFILAGSINGAVLVFSLLILLVMTVVVYLLRGSTRKNFLSYFRMIPIAYTYLLGRSAALMDIVFNMRK